jgi:threonine dehydrogenase-like Zn-dependent dehydrogenase
LIWAVEALAKAGTLSIIGVYPPTVRSFPIGKAMNKNLTVHMGNCNHRQYIPLLIDMVRSGEVDPGMPSSTEGGGILAILHQLAKPREHAL